MSSKRMGRHDRRNPPAHTQPMHTCTNSHTQTFTPTHVHTHTHTHRHTHTHTHTHTYTHTHTHAGLLPYLGTMTSLLLPKMADPRPMVRIITCWALSRYAFWLLAGVCVSMCVFMCVWVVSKRVVRIHITC